MADRVVPPVNVWNARMQRMAATRAAKLSPSTTDDPVWPQVGDSQPDRNTTSTSSPLTSASHSLHSSPKLARNGKKLPPEPDTNPLPANPDKPSDDIPRSKKLPARSHQSPSDSPPVLNHGHTSSNPSNSSSPRTQQFQLLSPPSSSTSAQSLQHSYSHPHGQSSYPHAPYPLYNLSINSYDYASAPRPSSYLPYSANPNLTTLPHHSQPGLLPNGMPPIQAPDTSRTKSTAVPPAREKMVFGSIDVSSSTADLKTANKLEEESKEDENEKKKPFAIGLENGHDLPGRSRSTHKKTGARATGGRLPSVKDKKKEKKIKEDDSTESTPAIAPKASTVEPRWTFGTTSVPSPLLPTSSAPPSPSQSAVKIDNTSEDDSLKLTQSTSGATTPFEPQSSSSFPPAPLTMPHPPSIPIDQPTHHHPHYIHLHHGRSPSAHDSAIPLPPPLSIPMQPPLSIPAPSSTSDPDLEVKDYGFGFGDASGLGYAPSMAKERAREWEAERARERAAVEVGDVQGLGFNEDVITSPMSESGPRDTADKDLSLYDQNLPREYMQPREHQFGRGRRGFPNGRGGGYGDRGAGAYRRARGSMNNFTRGFGRAGGHYGHHHNRGGTGGISPVNSRGGPSSPFNDTPPHHFQSLPLDSSGAPSPLLPPPVGGFYHPHPHHPIPGRPYIPPGYEAFNPSPTIAGVPPPLPIDPAGILLGQPQTHHPHLPQPYQSQMLTPGKHLTPPVPVPKTTISFPLDSTRYYLLGQLEYYLSAENMAQDFYLRQQMDARGWIPISLIASFNRVRQLTQDVQLVKDVLYLSSLVQVRGNMVRMGGWEPFVLPDAVPSTVEEQPLPYPYQNLTNFYFPEVLNPGVGLAEVVNGEVGVGGVVYPELLHATPLHHTHSPRGSSGEGPLMEGAGEVYPGGAAIIKADGSIVNGHAQEVDEDDEDEVEIVMGQGVGTYMYDRRTAS